MEDFILGFIDGELARPLLLPLWMNPENWNHACFRNKQFPSSIPTMKKPMIFGFVLLVLLSACQNEIQNAPFEPYAYTYS
ncbi:MAG: lipoprotein, partial [Bacteroidales bacterium]